MGFPVFGEPLRTFGAALGVMGGGGIVYLGRDQFSSTVSAGFATPLLSVPGPGNLVRSADVNNRVSEDNGDLWFNGAANVSYADPGYYFTDTAGGGFARQQGVTLIYRIIASGVAKLGFTTNVVVANATQVGILLNSTTLSYSRLGTDVLVGAGMSTLATYLVALTLRTSGIELRIKGGVYSEWSLLFVDTNWTTTPLWPSLSIAGTVNIRIPDYYLTAVIGALTSGSELLSASSPDTTILAAAADGVYQLTGTVPAGSAGNLIEFRYRQVDVNNYCLVRVEWNGSNYQLVSGHVIAGVETLQGSPIASIFSAGNAFRLEISAASNAHNFWSTAGTTWAKRYGIITDSAGQSNTGVSVRNVNFTATGVSGWTYQDAGIAAALDRVAS